MEKEVFMKTIAAAALLICLWFTIVLSLAQNVPAGSNSGSNCDPVWDTACVLTVYEVPKRALPDEICRAVYEIAEGLDFTIVAGDLNHGGTRVWIKVCGPESKIAEFVHELYD